MKRNMGTGDRIIRAILAIVFIVLYTTGTITGVYGIVLLVLSGIFILTALVGFCPLYALLKLNTLGHNRQQVTGQH